MRTIFADALARRSILLLVGVAMLAVTVIGLAGMSLSVMVAETVQGSASAINVAGSLRRLTHRAASLVAADAAHGRSPGPRVGDAIAQFEQHFTHAELQRVLGRSPDGMFAATYRGVEASWKLGLKPQLEDLQQAATAPTAEQLERLLAEVDSFVEQLNTLVAVLEHDTETRIGDLRQILAVAIVFTLVVVTLALVLLHRLLHRPLGDLLAAANRIGRGDFSARVGYTGRNELGRVGAAFNLMASELSKLYRDLEQRVEAKTAELQRSNRALELLYHAIARLYHAPAAAESYTETLHDIETVVGLEGSLACIEPRHDGPATVLASSLGPCPQRLAGGASAQACAQCREQAVPWSYQREGDRELLRVPLRDSERHYGMLRFALPAGRRLEDWQRQLVEALSRHIGMALGTARRNEQARLLALQEERSVIARELHDSLAQALSYMKIQAALLQPVLGDPARRGEADTILGDLRTGINAAYRQLRELLVSFRLQMSGDFPDLLRAAVDEYAGKGGIAVRLETRLADCPLGPNQEVHVLHIVREALSNMVRHARATAASVSLSCDAAHRVTVVVEDNGVGLGADAGVADLRNHHGMTIMRERARSLDGEITIGTAPDGGTRIELRFQARPRPERTEADGFTEAGNGLAGGQA